MLDYDEGFHTQFTSHFGSTIDTEMTRFMFEKGHRSSAGSATTSATPSRRRKVCEKNYTEQKLLDTIRRIRGRNT